MLQNRLTTLASSTGHPLIRRFLMAAVVLGCCLSARSAAVAQGLVWKLPAPNTWVQYEGEYRQTETRPKDISGEDLQITPWRRRLVVKALQQTQADYAGKTITCQWFEFVIETGREEAGVIATGPGSRRIYKVLVPLELLESSLGEPRDGLVLDAENIPIAYLPIVKGYRQFGNSPVEPIKTTAFNLYPTVTLLPNYRSLETLSEAADPEVTLAGVSSARHYRGQLAIESVTNRSQSRAEIWYSEESPFGVVRWQVDVSRESKASSAPRSAFATVSTYRVEMKAVGTGNDATSLLTEE